MIVPMKKVSVVVMDSDKKQVLKTLRKLGVLHIETMMGSGERLARLNEQVGSLENAIGIIEGRSLKNAVQKKVSTEETLILPKKIAEYTEERATLFTTLNFKKEELERLKGWGTLDPAELNGLAEKGVILSLYEMPQGEYARLSETATTVVFEKNKDCVRLLLVGMPKDTDLASFEKYRVKLPSCSTDELAAEVLAIEERIKKLDAALDEAICYVDSMRAAVAALQKEIEFEIYFSGMPEETLSEGCTNTFRVAYFVGYLPTKELDKIKIAAKENAWGILVEDPTPDDPVPTQLQNNKFVSLVYPLTDFLGTVPGYFEYDISAWFLGFILIFFGIIFGDGGYGLIVCGIVAVPIIRALVKKESVEPTFLLIGLMGVATILWGLLTCTWFGIAPEYLPKCLQALSIPVISNVYADKLWYLPWSGDAGLTTSQNVQIVCFTLALIQLSCAHLLSMIRHRKSLKCLADVGAIMQLLGIFYVVLSLVVNASVFPLGLSVFGIPISYIVIALIAVGFLINFSFANYEGNLIKSIVSNLKNIVSALLGVVNFFSDIVSYIRLWAVGLAGAAISATVNELAGPMLGNFVFMIFAIIILVFGHGLNMILNVLSVVVHGVRLNTLEFSTHLDMSWSGRKYQPFKE